LKPIIQKAHEDDQKHLDNIRTHGFDECDKVKAQNYATKIGSKKPQKERKDEHTSCRLGQNVWQNDLAVAEAALEKHSIGGCSIRGCSNMCDAFKNFKNSIRGCSRQLSDGPTSKTFYKILEWAEGTVSHLELEHKAFKSMRAECTSEKSNHEEFLRKKTEERNYAREGLHGVVEDCNSKQIALELHSCMIREEDLGVCFDWKQCWTRVNVDLQEAIATAKVNSEGRKTEVSIYERLLCYIDLLIKDDDATEEGIKQCKKMQPDTDHLNLVSPTPPEEPGACPVRDGPGDEAWRQNAYVDVPEHVEVLSTKACEPLPADWLTSTEAAQEQPLVGR